MKRVLSGALTLALLLGCGGQAGPVPSSTTSSPAGSSDANTGRLAVTVADFKITPSTLTSGSSVSINVTSQGPTPHNLTIRQGSGPVRVASTDLRTGESDSIDVQLERGEYTFFCSFAGHESLGMHGTLTVNP